MPTEDEIINGIFETEGIQNPTPVTEETTEATDEVTPEAAETEQVSETEKEGDAPTEETAEVVNEETNTTEPESFDTDKYIGEMSNGMFESEQELRDSGLLELPGKYDQLVDKYNQLVEKGDKEPEFASDYVKGLNDFILKGGDPKVYSEIVTVDYNEKSDFDIMKMSLKANDGLTDQEAEDYINSKYKLDADEFTEQESKLGSIELKRDSKSERESFIGMQKEAMTPRAVQETQTGPTEEEISSANEERIDKWDGVVTDEIKSIPDLEYEFGFKYEISEEQKDQIDDKVFDIVSKSGMEFTQENIDTVKQMAQNLFIQENHKQMMKSAYDFGLSQAREQKIKDDHNPSAVPETENRDSETKKTRSDYAIDMISKAEGIDLR